MTWYWIKNEKGRVAVKLVECTSNRNCIYEVYEYNNKGLQTIGQFTTVYSEDDLVPFIHEDFVYLI